jgi:hypothetical protein
MPGGHELDCTHQGCGWHCITRQPDDPNALAVKWEGERQITYETLRDMGIAYSLGLVLIYLLVVAQFGSYAGGEMRGPFQHRGSHDMRLEVGPPGGSFPRSPPTRPPFHGVR